MHPQRYSPTATAVCSTTGASGGTLLPASRGTRAVVRGRNGGGGCVSGECLETAVFPSLEEERESPIQYIQATLNAAAFPALGGADPPFHWLCISSSFLCAVATAIGQRRNEEKKRERIKKNQKTGGEEKKLGDLELRTGKG